MKKSIFIFSLIAIFAITLNSCQKDKEPTITVTPAGETTGWFGDEIVFDIEINSTGEVGLEVTNNHDDQSLTESYAAGESVTDFTYTIPNDVTDGQKIKVTFVVTDNETNLSSTVEETITISTGGTGADIVHEGTVTDIETWASEDNHIIRGSLYLQGGTITIEAGTVIKFEQDASLEIGDVANTTFIAQGTADNPITFTSANETPEAGDWKYIEFYDGITSNTVLEYCKFEYGGGDSYYDYALGIDDCQLKIDNCNFENIEGSAIKIEGEEEFVSFSNNTISNCGSYPIQIDINLAHSIGEGNTISSTGYGVLVLGYTFSQVNETWRKLDVPYTLLNSIDIESDNAQGATLNLAPGVTVAIINENNIEVGDSYSGSLIANGTESEPITFTSANASPEAGDWDYIYLDEYTKNTTNFEYCVFEYGGGNNYFNYMVGLDNSNASFYNCIFRNSANQGLKLTGSSEFNGFDNNTIENCATYPLYIPANAVHTIGTDNTFTTDLYGILINKDEGDYTLTTEHIWAKQNCAYIIEGLIEIQSEYASGAILRIAPGAEFHFKPDAGLEVADNYNGTLYAEGTAEEPIIFTTSNSSPQAGQWDYIYFDEGTNPGTILDYCNISYGGASDYWNGNIVVDDTDNVTISNCNISNSNGFGIYLMGTVTPPNSYDADNTFSNNTNGNVGSN